MLKNCYLIEPNLDLEGRFNLLIEDGRIRAITKESLRAKEVLDLEGKVLCPPFCDLHTHTRYPGQTYKEEPESLCKSAISGGFSYLLAMPNTNPPMDEPERVLEVEETFKGIGLCKVVQSATLSVGREGKRLVDFYKFLERGIRFFTDDGSNLQEPALMEMALKYSKALDFLVLNHCEERSLSRGKVNEGLVSEVLGIEGRKPSAEEVVVARDCILSYRTGGRIHLQHISTGLSVKIIRFFKELGARVSAEVNPIHFTLTQESVLNFGARALLNPPLRGEEDLELITEGIRDGTIDCVATDHAPHRSFEKEILQDSLPGVIGLQTALPLTLELWRRGKISLRKVVELLSTNPLRILGERVRVKEGEVANFVVFDPNEEWTYEEKTNLSKSSNTPFLGKRLKGKVVLLVREGKLVYKGT